MYNIQFLINPLYKKSPNSKITSITHNFKGQFPIRWLYYRSGYQSFLKNFEGFLTIFIKKKRNVLLEKISEGSRSHRKVFNKSSIETSMTEKTTNTFDVPWVGHPFNFIDLGSVHFNSPLGNLVAKNNSLVDHKVALLPVKHQIFLLTSLQNFIKVVDTMVKRGSIDGEIVHEYLHNFFTKTMKDSRHTPLKSSKGIT